jgi:hypothetical protein
MKHQLAAAVSALFLAAVAAPVHATTTSFIASLGALGEPVPTSLATGFATVSFDDVLFKVSVAGTGNAGVSLGFNALPAATSGSYSDSFTLASSAFGTLFTGVSTGKAYVNIHTPGTYGGGEIRGFLAPIPEPETYALMLAGLAAVAWAARKRSV